MTRWNQAVFLTAFAGLLACAPSVTPLPRCAPKPRTLTIPPVVESFADLGKLDETQSLDVTMALPLNHEEELDQRLMEVYQPGSPGFHHFINPQEFADRYA